MAVRLLVGDCIDELKKLPSDSIDSIVTDPPYGLSFMGKKWDYDVPAKEMWVEALRVLKPGGHLISFGGSRTYHRMAVAIEDAGFEIRDQIMWLYGSGFPKSHNIGKAIDKAAGAEREVVGYDASKARPNKATYAKMSAAVAPEAAEGVKDNGATVTAPATPEAQQWDGWGTALKPAHEPCVLARKPFSTTVVENVLEHGTGALNIDGCRVGEDGGTRKPGPPSYKPGISLQGSVSGSLNGGGCEPIDAGRWPANVIHDGSDEVVSMFPESKTNRIEKPCENPEITGHRWGTVQGNRGARGYDGEGSAARFFYCAKPGRAEREAGLEDHDENVTNDGRKKGIDNAYQRGMTLRKNLHPTVKPVDLMRYLCRLVTPPGGVVLDPFMGSGTTGIAAIQEGFDFVGIEREPDYAEIAAARIAHWGNADLTELEDGSVEVELPPETEWL
jgi:DNA modification methylase